GAGGAAAAGAGLWAGSAGGGALARAGGGAPAAARLKPGGWGCAGGGCGGGGSASAALLSAVCGEGTALDGASTGVWQVTHFAAQTTFRKSQLGQMTPRLLRRSADMAGKGRQDSR